MDSVITVRIVRMNYLMELRILWNGRSTTVIMLRVNGNELCCSIKNCFDNHSDDMKNVWNKLSNK